MRKNHALSRLTAAGCLVGAVFYTMPACFGSELANSHPGEVAVALPSAAPLEGAVTESEVVTIDNDEIKPEAVYNWKEIQDGPGKTHIQTGARFPIAIQSQLSSKTAKVGDPIEGRLQVDIKIGGKLIAAKGTPVVGHVISVVRARKLIMAEFTPNKRWLRMSGSIGIQFDEIITDKNEHIPLIATPARNARIVKNAADGRELGVNHAGEIASPLSGQLKGQALHTAIRGAASAGGVFSFGIVPLAYGITGAISPSFAMMQPVGKNVRHRRLKGFSMGVLQGLPGGFLVSDSIIRGPEAIIQPGDTFEAEFKQDFTGEAATDANLLPGVKTKVHGEVVPEADKK